MDVAFTKRYLRSKKYVASSPGQARTPGRMSDASRLPLSQMPITRDRGEQYSIFYFKAPRRPLTFSERGPMRQSDRANSVRDSWLRRW